MFPAQPIFQPPNDRWVHSVLKRNGGLCAWVLNNGKNLPLCKLRVPMLLAVMVSAVPYLVRTVLDWRGPAKIAKAAIRAVTIAMSGMHMGGRARSTKGRQYQDVNVPSLIYAVFAQIYAPVLARFMPVRHTYAASHASNTSVFHGSAPRLATDSPKIANRVNPLVTNDREPSFNSFIHEQLCHGSRQYRALHVAFTRKGG